ncbi:MAG: hypothetical protein K0B15_17025 [Lentimicrobium sp.]|nr:hypothetical protein [Lentimicrobium sp.]
MKKIILLIVPAMLLYACFNTSQPPAAEATDQTSQFNENQMVIETDMENVATLPSYWINQAVVVKMDKTPAHSGNYAAKLDATEKYSLTFRENFANINAKLPKRVVVNGWYYFAEPNDKAGMVMEINENGSNYIWKAFNFSDVDKTINQWNEFTAYFAIDKPITPDHQIKVFGNGAGKLLYLDDIRITFEY